MADYDSNMIKPVEGLHSITALTPTKRREERRQQKQFGQENDKKNEQLLSESENKQDIDNHSEILKENQDDSDSDETSIDYCA